VSQLSNARRTIEKAEEVLRHVDQYFEHKDAMNAAAHRSDRVLQSPLHAEVVSVLEGIGNFHSTFPDAETRAHDG
jgi:hypothetical protein